MCCAMSGATIPNNRPQNEATPHAVPRIGAANTSGVQPYSTTQNTHRQSRYSESIVMLRMLTGIEHALEEVLHDVISDVARLAVGSAEDEDRD